jgi:hypothetical protein
MTRCQVFVSPRENSIDGYSTDKCVICGRQWYYHNNIGSGWRERSETEKIHIGMYPNIILGEG